MEKVEPMKDEDILPFVEPPRTSPGRLRDGRVLVGTLEAHDEGDRVLYHVFPIPSVPMKIVGGLLEDLYAEDFEAIE